jgi:O-antigen/teichoic acid export membrane protein
MVVGAFVSAAAVTFYSIGNTLCRYTLQFVVAMTTTFIPAASKLDAEGHTAGLRSLYYSGTRATMAVSLPVVITLIVRGGSFIGLWMGPQYARSSGTVLAILAAALMISLQNTTMGAIAFGVEKHQTQAKYAIGEGVANLALSIVLARKFGIYGVAIGTLVPNLVVNLFFWPRYVSRLVDVSWVQVYRDVSGPVFICGVPFAAASYAVDVLFPARNMVIFALQTTALLPIFAIAICVIFRDNVRRQILPKVRSFFYADAK